jgi:hypothetical protein
MDVGRKKLGFDEIECSSILKLFVDSKDLPHGQCPQKEPKNAVSAYAWEATLKFFAAIRSQMMNYFGKVLARKKLWLHFGPKSTFKVVRIKFLGCQN